MMMMTARHIVDDSLVKLIIRIRQCNCCSFRSIVSSYTYCRFTISSTKKV